MLINLTGQEDKNVRIVLDWEVDYVIDVCVDIYVMMSSDLYGACNSVDVIVMSRTNSNLPYRTQRRRNA